MPRKSTKIDIKAQVWALAKEHRVTYVVGPRDNLAQTMSNLAGNSVRLDQTGKMIVALQRAGIITRDKAVLMQAEYMRQAIS